jgi:hypothetical protein
LILSLWPVTKVPQADVPHLSMHTEEMLALQGIWVKVAPVSHSQKLRQIMPE